MKYTLLVMISSLLLSVTSTYAQAIKLDKSRLTPHQVSMSTETIMGKDALRVVKDSTAKGGDEPTFVRINGLTFSDGTIEVKVLSRLLENASPMARGFIGLAFRVNDDNSKYESIYIRPANGRADDQVRRNHSIQYYAYPNHKFDQLRKEAPERYESYADMTLNEWITMKIVVDGDKARLYLNDVKQPSLIVNDLKCGATVSGAIALWVESGTEGYFADLKITK